MERFTDLFSKHRENTLFYDFNDIKKLSKSGNKYLGKCIPYDKLGEYETNCIPIAHFYDENNVLQVVFSKDPSHALGVGCTGAGKTTSLVIPKVNILSSLKNKPSFVIIDVKGELHDKLSGHLKEKGYDIKVIDLDEPEYSVSWNPLLSIYDKYMDAHTLVDKVVEHDDSINDYPHILKFAFKGKPKVWYEFDNVAYSDVTNLNKAISHKREKLIADVSEEIRDLSYMFIVTQNMDDPHWDDTARDLFAGVIFAMLERTVLENGKCLTRNQFNLRNIVNAILSSSDGELRSFINNSDKNGEAYRFANKIVNMQAEKTKSCYYGVLSTQLSPFKSYSIQKVTIKNTVDFDKIIKEPQAVFIKMDDLKESNYKLAQLMILRLYQQMKNIAKKEPNRTLPKPIHFILDEFGNFPKFNEFGKMISVSRSYNIWYTMVVQSYSQLNMIYGKEVSNVIIENSNMRLFFGTNDFYTMKSFSEACGRKAAISEVAYLNGDSSKLSSCPIEELPTVPVSDLAKIGPSEVYITCFGLPVLHSRMERYYLVKEFTPLDPIEYRVLDNIEIGKKEYTYNVGDDDYIFSGKKQFPTKYVAKKREEVNIKKKIDEVDTKKMLGYLGYLISEKHPMKFAINSVSESGNSLLPQYIIDYLKNYKMTDMVNAFFDDDNSIKEYSKEFYKNLNSEIIKTFFDNNIDDFDVTSPDLFNEVKKAFKNKVKEFFTDCRIAFPSEFCDNLVNLIKSFEDNVLDYIKKYIALD